MPSLHTENGVTFETPNHTAGDVVVLKIGVSREIQLTGILTPQETVNLIHLLADALPHLKPISEDTALFTPPKKTAMGKI